MTTNICPYCGSVMEYTPESTAPYYCPQCDAVFTNNDMLYEEIRRKITMLLVDTTEDNPRKHNIVISDEENTDLGYFPDEYVLVNSSFLDDDDNIFFNIEGMDEPISFDDLDYEEVKSIYDLMI